ncbi:MAG: hypothetical protein KJO54_08430 [Gammaproteobacteria bacterium]|nr:hypothetical protein [Gammaproteobacteria bacterium]NNF60163.1 hypothetical protein [Gammaproteobacteria bacterium]NNM21576.1 hypothetical protein [Gammaproteobacteria bacterium]
MGSVDLTGDVIEPELGRHILAELASLNAGFLDLATSRVNGHALLPADQQSALAGLSDAAKRRLADCAFALFDLKLCNVQCWRQLRAGGAGDELRISGHTDNHEIGLFTLSALMYLRHLADVNRFFARLSFGAPLDVLRIISTLPISRLRVIAHDYPGLLHTRFCSQPGAWAGLLRLASRSDTDTLLPATILGYQHLGQQSAARE